MPAGGAAWMVVWIMLGLCAVPLVHVVRYYPFWSIVVSVVTHLLVWLSLGGQAWVVYGRLAEPTDAGMGPGCPLSRLRGHSRGRMAEGPGRRMEDAIRVFPPLMPTWQGTDWRRTWGRLFLCRLWGSDYEGHLVQGVSPVHVV